MGELHAVRNSFVQLWGNLGSSWGITPTAARIYSWLLSRAEGADSEEIMTGLELSRGAVSMAVRELKDWGLVVAEKRGRRWVHLPATDLEKVIRNIVKTRKRREWDPIMESLREWIPRLESTSGDDEKVFRERLLSFQRAMQTADSMIEVFLEGGLLSDLGLKALVSASGRRAKQAVSRQAGEAR